MSQTNETKKKDFRSPFDDFEMSEEAAVNGIRVPYNGYYFDIAYSGGENPAFAKALEIMLAPVRAAFPDMTNSDPQYLNIVKRCFCENNVKKWGCDAFGKGFMIGADGEKISWSPKNIADFLLNPKLAKLLDQLMQVSSSYQRYLAAANKADAKN